MIPKTYGVSLFYDAEVHTLWGKKNVHDTA